MLFSLAKRGDKTCSPAHLPSKQVGIPHPPVLGSLGVAQPRGVEEGSGTLVLHR